ncbi:MAG: flagellar hook assembly protein FlgD [Gemmatimonadaceae bacterium]
MTTTTSVTAPTSSTPSASPRSPSKIADTKDQFLKLLVAQMKNQDPESPTDPAAMMSQLATFTSVEQLMAIKDGLASQAAQAAQAFSLMQATAAMSAIGRTVVARGNALEHSAAAPATDITASIGAVGQGKLQIRDQNAVVVREADLGLVDRGEQSISIVSLTNDLAPGRYTYDLTVTGADGAAVDVTPYMTTMVEGVAPSGEGLMLLTPAGAVPFSAIIEVRR